MNNSGLKKPPIVRQIGTALVGGDFTGNARGTNAIDLSTNRPTATDVASGANSINIGNTVKASGSKSIAIGYVSDTSGVSSIVLGADSTCESNYTVVIGPNNLAGTTSSYESVLIGRSLYVTNRGNVVLGNSITATGQLGICIGDGGSVLTTNYGVAIGFAAYVAAINGLALGSNTRCESGADNAISIGYAARSRVANTINIAALAIIRKDEIGFTIGNEPRLGSASKSITSSKEIDLTTTGTYTITLPTGSRIKPTDLHLYISSIDGTLTSQPTVQFGISGNNSKLVDPVALTVSDTLHESEEWLALKSRAFEQTITMEVTVASVLDEATEHKARLLVEGIVIEVQ
jgi:hypothetical protein